MARVKYDIAVKPVDTPLSNNRMKTDYVYVFPNDDDYEKEVEKIKRKRKKGWTKYDSDSVVHHSKRSHLWFYTVYYKRKSPEKRIKH